MDNIKFYEVSAEYVEYLAFAFTKIYKDIQKYFK